MASSLFPFPITISLRHWRRRSLPLPPIDNSLTFLSTTSSTPTDSYKCTFHPSFHSRRNYWPGRSRNATSQPEPPPEKHQSSSSGILTTFTRFKDTLQIFFAVLFWMSLFFWSCAWDGGNGGRPNKRNQTRK